jgi:hypothetical protein
MADRRLVSACAAALLFGACGNVEPDWGFEEKVDWDIGLGSDLEAADGGTAPIDPCADLDAGICDPLTNAGCDADAGYACSYYAEAEGGFACLSDSTEPAGAACDGEDGPWCGPALACVPGVGAGTCVPFCCGDDDCADGGTCAAFDYPGLESAFGACDPS